MAEKTKVLICYDVVNTKRWYKIHALLCDTAISIQYSVFEAELNQVQLEQLIKGLSALLAPNEDKLTIYRLFPKNTKIELAKGADYEIFLI